LRIADAALCADDRPLDHRQQFLFEHLFPQSAQRPNGAPAAAFSISEDPNVLQRATNTLIASALAACLAAATLPPSSACAQGMGSGMPAIPQSMFGPKKAPREAAGPSLSATDEPVADIRIVGNRTIPTSQILDELQTRVGRPFDPALVQKDVRKLASRGWFVHVEPTYERAPNGRIVIFKVAERPVIRYVEYLGNSGIRTKKLAKETDLKVGGPIDPYAVEEARRKIISLYQRNGYNEAQVTILKGTKPEDQGIVFVINEGTMQKVWKVEFEGNTFASDGQLRTHIETKKPFMLIFKGFVDREQIDGDVDRLTAYYRRFGFFHARVGRQFIFNEKNTWMTLRFVIQEGPRFDVESVAFLGNKLFATESLAMGIVMPGGKPFEQAKMNDDVAWLKELYGSQGYVFADIEAEPIFLEEPGKLKLLYKIEEGKRWRIGNVFVHINGDNPHTKIQTALNRLSIRSGEIADIREIRASERRLQHSGLFLADPARGVMPKITYHIPELDETEMAEGDGTGFRGQSPDAWQVGPPSRGGLETSNLHAGAARLTTSTAGPPLIAPPGTIPSASAAPVVPTASSHQTYKVPTPSGILRTGYEVDVHVYLDTAAEQSTAVTVDPVPSPAAQRYEVRRPPYDQPQATNPYRQLTVRTQSPYQPPSSAYQPAAGSATANGYGGQAVGATGPGGGSATSTYPVRQAAITEPQLPPTQSGSPVMAAPQPTPAFGPPPMLPPPQQQYAPQYPPGGQPQYAPVPQYGPPPPAYTAPPALNPDPNITPIPIPSNPQQMPYPENELTPMFQDPAVDLDVVLSEAQTGRLMLGVAVNSDAGLVGQILLDEQNFDWTRWPTSWDDFLSGKAWRGGGQRFRIEAAPGTEVHRYLVSFQEPYLMDTPVSLGLSGSFFDRRYDDWDEQRLGGRISLGYQWTEDDVSAAIAYRGESIKISNISTPIPDLVEVEGENALHGFKFTLANDTRDSAFLATQGHFLQLELEQVVGSFEYPRAIFEGRKYFLIDERPDHTGRHVVTGSTRLGFTGDDTPIYDRFYAGGFSTLRGFDFRGANPVESGVSVGGDFMWVNTLEYLFPVTADDMIHGVAFVDFGTVEENVEIENFRIAPGFGMRITIPAMGPAPIALDFAFPVAEAPFDDKQVFSFNIGLQR
jgi:outer membrane protein insertion porin family